MRVVVNGNGMRVIPNYRLTLVSSLLGGRRFFFLGETRRSF